MRNVKKAKFFSKNKNKEKTKTEKSGDDVKAILSDPRFAHITSDPRYRNISQKSTKIQIDKRFKDALMNERFNVKPMLDSRGRPRSYGTKESLSKFYDLQSSEDESEDESEGDESETTDSNEEEQECGIERSPKNRKTVKTKSENSERDFLVSLLDPERDLARGDNFYSDDSSDDDSSTTDEEEEQEEFKDFEWGELDVDAHWDVDGNEVEETNRFAVCDMDWNNVKAVDLFVLFSSFAPAEGCLKKVTIYPSEFGKKRMAEEDVSGPAELVKLASFRCNRKNKDDFSNLEKIEKGILNEDDCASSLELEALRRYERNRLKYYYGVVECDTVETAKIIYKECDRSHFEVIGINLDLRYIPSGMQFDEVPYDVCEKIPESYENDYITATAICHSKPILTWDATDKRRKKILENAMAKALKKENFDDNVFNGFVAASGSDEDDNSEADENKFSDDENVEGQTIEEKKKAKVAKFRALINEIEEKERRKKESTFTFEEEEAFAASHERDSEEEREEENEDSSDEDKKSNEEPGDDEFKNLTPFETMLLKGKKKKQEKKRLTKNLKEKNELHVLNSSKVSKKKKKKIIENEDVPENSNDDLALLVMDEEQEEKKHFDMEKIKEQKEKMMKKKKRKWNNKNDEEIDKEMNDDNFKINTSDSRFSDLFTSGDFNMDPSHPKFDKHSSAAKDIIQKQKKMKLTSLPVNNSNKTNNEDERYSKVDSNISAMIRKFKMKTPV